MVFYMAAIESNRNATLVFEEPEAHAFPYYIKHLAECIALDENKNQYFIATHNPYLLTAIWEKSQRMTDRCFCDLLPRLRNQSEGADD